MQGREISQDTLAAVKQISAFLAMLADKYRSEQEGQLQLDDE
jgi:hypothetical protein